MTNKTQKARGVNSVGGFNPPPKETRWKKGCPSPNPATTSNCTGVQFAQGLNAGMTPVCTTPPTFVASGASHAVGYVPDPGASAGTTHFLREDATWQTIPPSGVTEATLSTGAFAVSWNIACTAGSTGHCAYTTFANAHTLVRITYDLTQAPSSCATNAVVGVRDVTASSNVATITVNQGVTGYVDSGALSVAMTAGHEFLVGVITAAATCTTVPNGHSIVAVFQ